MPQQRRTSIIPHLAQIVQSVVAPRYTKVLAQHKKRVKVLEARVVEGFFDLEAQRVYEEKPNLAKTMNKTSWTISWHRPDYDKELSARIGELTRQLKAIKDDDGSFYLTDGLDLGRAAAKEMETMYRHQFTRGADQLGTPFRPGGHNRYTRVGPTGLHSVYVMPKSAKKEKTSYDAATHFVADSLWREAVDLEIKLLQMHTEATLLAHDLMKDFAERRTIERFVEEFPELTKHVPYIPTPVKALIVPASAVLAKLEAVPAE